MRGQCKERVLTSAGMPHRSQQGIAACPSVGQSVVVDPSRNRICSRGDLYVGSLPKVEQGSRRSVIYCLPRGRAKCCSCALGDLYVGSLPRGGQGSRRSLPCEQAAYVQQTFMVKGGAVVSVRRRPSASAIDEHVESVPNRSMRSAAQRPPRGGRQQLDECAK